MNTTFLSNAPTALSQADMNGVATAAGQAYSTTLLTQMHGLVEMVQCEAVDISHRGGFTGTAVLAGVGGLVGTQYAPVNAAVVVTERTGLRWRGGHPRMYLPAPPVDRIVNGKTLLQAYVDTLTTAAANFRIALNSIQVQAVNLRWSCVRYYDLGVLLSIPIILNVDSTVIKNRLDTQRRRLGREVA